MSDGFSFAEIVSCLPGVLDDILNSDRQPEIAMIMVIAEGAEKTMADFIINTGPEDAIRLLREAIENIEQSMTDDPETMQ